MSSGFQCSYCGEWNASEVDESAGASQQYVEDCQVRCQPNILTVRFDRTQDEFVIRAQREN
jgi:Cysteine-rich CPXCG